jgi:DNA polymerase-1
MGGSSQKTGYGALFETSDSTVFHDDPQSAADKLQKLQNSKNIIIDVQTTGPDPFAHKIRSVQISDGEGVLVSVGLQDLQGGCKPLVAALLHGSSGKVFHDAKTQMKFLRLAGFEITGPFIDTMLGAQLLEAGVRDYKYDLASVSKRQLAEESSNRIETIRELTRYQFTKLRSDGLSETARLEFSCLPAVLEMELDGVLLDTEKWKKLADDLLGQKDQFEKALHDEFGQINLDSPNDLLKALQARGIDVSDTNRQTLASLSDQYPILDKVTGYRKVSKLVQGFILPLPQFINEKTGRIHPEYNQLGATTGRFSCRNPNLQQIPRDKRFRECIVASPGHLLIIADYSQIELRVAAEITGDERMVQAFQEGVDLHKLTAAVITGKQIDEVNAKERQAAKAVNFGLIFGMGADGLMNYARDTYGVAMTVDQARGFRTRFFRYYQGIGAWHEKVQRSRALETRMIGNRRRVWNKLAPLTELLNTPVQGTAADIIKKALCLIFGRLQGTGSRIIASIHDEIIIESSKLFSIENADIIEQSMVEAAQNYINRFPVTLKIHDSDSWM